MIIKLYSWNVNGIRAVIKKGTFQQFIAEHQPDIVGLQETKVDEAWTVDRRETKSAINNELFLRQEVAVATSRSKKVVSDADFDSEPNSPRPVSLTAEQGQAEIDLPEYEEFWNSATKKGYSGTAIFTKIKPLSVTNDVPSEIAKDGDFTDKYGDPLSEGRITTAEFKTFYYVTVYTPNSKGDLSRLDLRHKLWDPGFLAYLKHLEQTKPVVVSGDLNVAYSEDDLANPKPNVGKHGFTNEEREGFQKFLDAGFVDTFRIFTPTGNGHYTWWTHWANARARNIGWRIDYFLVSASLKNNVTAANIHADVLGSDHCPVSIELDI